jgi:hypothetical protein
MRIAYGRSTYAAFAFEWVQFLPIVAYFAPLG